MERKEIITLEEFIIQREKAEEGSGAFSQVLRDIALAARIIHFHVNRAGLEDILGSTGRVNVQGEEVQKLDEFANEVFRKALSRGGQVCMVASEEDEEPTFIENAPAGKYIVLYDPLDGSSNIDVNVPIGSIFSIYQRKDMMRPVQKEDALRKGVEQIAAGYIIYGSSTLLVYTAGNGVNGFTLDPSYGEFFLSHPNIQMPSKLKYYSFNDANFNKFSPEVQRYIEDLRKRAVEEKISSRYVGSLVADFHRNLLKGGLFMYPAVSGKPKLRLLYEANPMAFIVEQAGGAASDGTQNILTIQPQQLHQRVPLFIGPKDEIQKIQSYLLTHQTA